MPHRCPATLCLPEPWPLGTLPGSQVTGQDLLHHAGDADACELHITHAPGCAYTCTHHTHHCEYKLAYIHTCTHGHAHSYAYITHSMQVYLHTHTYKRTHATHIHTCTHNTYAHTHKHIPQKDKASGGGCVLSAQRGLVKQKSPEIWRPTGPARRVVLSWEAWLRSPGRRTLSSHTHAPGDR